MRHSRWTTLLAAVTVVALGGIGTAPAFASETLSFIPASGKFPIKNVTLKGGNVWVKQEEDSLVCTGGLTGEGEITGHKTAKMTLTFKGCATGLAQCGNTTSEEVVTPVLPVELVYTSKEHHEAALDFNYAEPPPPPFGGSPRTPLVTWSCRGQGPYGIRGSIIVPVTPTNTHTLTFKLKPSEKARVQSPTVYETEAGTKSEAFPEMALEGTFYSKGAFTTAGEPEVTIPAREVEIEIKA